MHKYRFINSDKYQVHNTLAAITGDDRYAALNEVISISEKTVFFGGAGVSTESGIPDFRSKDGLYHQQDNEFSKYRPEYLLSGACLADKPEVFFKFCRQKLDVRDVKPNAAHYKLAEMEKAGKLAGIITQNIDGLHQKAGSVNVAEIHGSIEHAYCCDCKKEYPSGYIFESSEKVPKCPECGGVVRPDVTLYGENLPGQEWKKAISYIEDADCLIIGGTSLAVYSAYVLVRNFHGRFIVVINKGRLRYDVNADLEFDESISKVLGIIDIG